MIDSTDTEEEVEYKGQGGFLKMEVESNRQSEDVGTRFLASAGNETLLLFSSGNLYQGGLQEGKKVRWEEGTRVHRVLGIQERSAIQGLVVPGSHGSSKHIVVDSSTGSKEMEPEGSLQLSSNMQLKLNSPLVS